MSLYNEPKQKFPDQHLSNTHKHPLTYNTFIKWGMDHLFWNDGLYYHTDAPWSTNPDIQAGIHCILLLGCVQEEFGIIGQELACAVGWGVERFSKLTATVNCIKNCIKLIRNDPNTAANHIDNLSLVGFYLGPEPRRESESNSSPLLLVDEELEDAVLEVDHDDGEDVAEETIHDAGSDIPVMCMMSNEPYG
ncbi:hypothetical protein PSHT_05899 [Puccinia striiformis]|uniref:Uncharacterized protein n=1 Tax=Puccinia striiformis TaxID=27350 RepID=A0A2S4W9E1_9BASI|nr:hypothetical protein PSHT_05899 [Puccinia striiformis]